MGIHCSVRSPDWSGWFVFHFHQIFGFIWPVQNTEKLNCNHPVKE